MNAFENDFFSRNKNNGKKANHAVSQNLPFMYGKDSRILDNSSSQKETTCGFGTLWLWDLFTFRNISYIFSRIRMDRDRFAQPFDVKTEPVVVGYFAAATIQAQPLG